MIKGNLTWSEFAKQYNKALGTNYNGESLRGAYRRKGLVERKSEKQSSAYELLQKKPPADNNGKPGLFFVTCAEGSGVVNPVFKKCIDTFLAHNKAQLVILGVRAHHRALEGGDDYQFEGAEREMRFNSNLRAIDAGLNIQQTNPITGLSGMAEDGESLIVGHSKQSLKALAQANDKLPRLLVTTGMITDPKYLPNAQGRKARRGHVMGGLIVRVVDDKLYHLRQVQFRGKSLFDLGVEYKPDGSVVHGRVAGMKLGDIHVQQFPWMESPFEDDKNLKATADMIHQLNPKSVYLEDVFDGLSVSHHMREKVVERSKKQPSLKEEFSGTAGFLRSLEPLMPSDCEGVVTSANHHNFLKRYILEGAFMKDKENMAIGLRLANKYVNENMNFEQILKEELDPADRWHFCHPNEDRYVADVLMSPHGHLGLNGRKGSVSTFASHFSRAMLAHFHTCELQRGVMVVGVLGPLRQGYNDGPSTWLPANGVVNKDGSMQLLIIIDGEWR